MKKRIKFLIDYKDDILNRNVTVETRDGRPVQIVAWDLKGRFPILVRTTVKRTNFEGDESWEEERPFAYSLEGKTEDGFSEKDLMIVSEEISEFEEAVANLVWRDSKDKEWSSDVKQTVEKLMTLARKEIISELPHWKPVNEPVYLKDLHLVRKRDGTYTTAYDHMLYNYDDQYAGVASEYYISVAELFDALVKDID